MPKIQTQKSRFKSKYTSGYISASQYLAEFCCERKASKENRALCARFWEDADWCKFFKFQVVIAARLLKKYHPLAIAEGLRLTKGCYSLSAKFLLPAIETCQLKYKDRLLEYEQSEYEYEPIIEQRSVVLEDQRKPFVQKNEVSLLSKLD